MGTRDERQITLTTPELGLVVGTRAGLGAGLALLLGERWRRAEQRRAVGWALVVVGVLTTFPLVAEIFGRREAADSASPES